MLPPAWFLLALLTVGALHWAVPGPTLLHWPVTLLGLPLVVAGLLLLVLPARAFDRVKTDIHPFHRPAVFRWYRVCRNPMYLGMIAVTVGAAVLLGSLAPLLVPPALLVLLDRRFVRREEAALREAFGAEYEAYCQRVRRWL